MSGAPFRRTAGGVELFVRLTPRGGTDRIDGIAAGTADGSRLAARVRAVPEKGAANAALERLVADALGVPKRAVQVVAGHGSRLKTVAVEGDADALSRAAEALAASDAAASAPSRPARRGVGKRA